MQQAELAELAAALAAALAQAALAADQQAEWRGWECIGTFGNYCEALGPAQSQQLQFAKTLGRGIFQEVLGLEE